MLGEYLRVKESDFSQVDPVARRIAGVGICVRADVFYPLPDLRAFRNHELPKAATASADIDADEFVMKVSLSSPTTAYNEDFLVEKYRGGV